MVACNRRTGTTKSPRRILIDLTIEDFDIKPDIPDGVYNNSIRSRSKPYQAQGCFRGKKYNLGQFSDPQEAGRVYQDFKLDRERWLRQHGKL